MPVPDPLLTITEALANGAEVDWAAAALAVEPALLASLQELQRLAQGFGQVAAPTAPSPQTRRLPRGHDQRSLPATPNDPDLELRHYDFALEKIGAEQRDLLGMRFELGLDYAEIARLHGAVGGEQARNDVVEALLALAQIYARDN